MTDARTKAMAYFHRRSEARMGSSHNAGHNSYASLQGKSPHLDVRYKEAYKGTQI